MQSQLPNRSDQGRFSQKSKRPASLRPNHVIVIIITELEANRPGRLRPEGEARKFDSETPSHRRFHVRTSQGRLGQKPRRASSLRKPPTPFGAEVFPL